MVQKNQRRGLSRPQQGSGRTRGRPRQYDPEQALAKAAEAFWKHGYAATSLDDLVRRDRHEPAEPVCGLRRQARPLSEDADALSAAIAGDRRRRSPPTIRRCGFFSSASTRPHSTSILATGDEARGCYSISTAPAQAATDPAVRDFLAASIGSTDAFLAKQIAKARERGEVPSNADPHALAQIATAALHTVAVRARVGVPRKQLRPSRPLRST